MLRQKEKMLVISIFFFCVNVFPRLVYYGCQNQVLFGMGLMNYLSDLPAKLGFQLQSKYLSNDIGQFGFIFEHTAHDNVAYSCVLTTLLMMDTLLMTIVLGFLTFVAYKLLTFIYWYYTLCVKLRKIPQIKSHWLNGNLDQIRDPISYTKLINGLVKERGVRMYCIWAGPFPVLGTTHPDTIKQLIKQESRKAKDALEDGYRFLIPWIGDGLLVSNGKKWERNRKLLTPAFHFDILKGYVTSMNKASDTFTNKLAEASSGGKPFDLFPYTCKLTLDVMLRCSLSYDKADEIQNQKDVPYIKAVRRLSEIIYRRALTPLYYFDWMFKLSSLGREHDRLTDYVHKFTGNLIKSRKQNLALKEIDAQNGVSKRKLDFLDILLTAKDEEGRGLSDEEIQHEVDTFTFEGHDTTSSAIAWTIYALGKHPELQDKVYNEVCEVIGDKTQVDYEDIAHFKYMSMFIKESIRIYTTVPDISRRHTTPIMLDGIEIPVGPRVHINISALHYNENVWKKPEVFDPERFSVHSETELYGFIPFSAGSRNCIGQNFALNEIKITIAKVVKRFRVSIEDAPEPIMLPELIMKSSNGLHVKLQSRE